ncbi:MAG: Gfo/Idh/MocA family oxidoreductase [Phycisphaerales bacterium]|nr:Gfo/Idh/MocA family oxidoreductase [Phycisphaerales bacterium]
MAPLTYGMIGGGKDAFIGAVHRIAAALDLQASLVAGALSSTPERSRESGAALGLAPDRCYATWRAMLEGERARPAHDRISFVIIVTPNHAHFEPAREFAAAGFHVVLDKPMVLDSNQASELVLTVRAAGTVFAVTYNYSGYPLVKHARHMVRAGEIGRVRKVIVEYHQGWLATHLEASGQKQASWRTDPSRSGLGGAIGDIGSHAEQLVSYVTGLELEAICADLTSFVPGRKLDDDASLLLRFRGGAKGILSASQIQIGHENDLSLRVYGETGSLLWRQEEPNALIHRPLGQPDRVLRRGNPYLAPEAQAATRLPPGHPEAFFEAFANVYRGALAAMRRERSLLDFPTVEDGARGVRFIERTVESAASSAKWTPF